MRVLQNFRWTQNGFKFMAVDLRWYYKFSFQPFLSIIFIFLFYERIWVTAPKLIDSLTALVLRFLFDSQCLVWKYGDFQWSPFQEEFLQKHLGNTYPRSTWVPILWHVKVLLMCSQKCIKELWKLRSAFDSAHCHSLWIAFEMVGSCCELVFLLSFLGPSLDGS